MTLGKFDGRRRGHQKLLRTMMELKAGTGYPTTVFTFDTAPETTITGRPQTVIATNLEHRANIGKVGIDYLAEYPFTNKTHHVGPGTFVRDILTGRMHAREIVINPDCSFGCKGTGDATLLLTMVHDPGYRLHVIEKEKDHRRDISSTYIREELEEDNMEKANQLLGQPRAIHEGVVRSNHIGGNLLGFPTTNMLPPSIRRLPRYSVYVSCVLVDDIYYKGITNIGEKPTVGGEYPTGVEIYVLGLEDDIYGRNIEIQILAFDHPEQKFISLEGLKERIEKDKEFTNAYYEEHPGILIGK